MMKYLLQIYLHKAWWEEQTSTARVGFAEACRANVAALTAQGYLLAAQGLDNHSTTLVNLEAGTVCVSDGPFPATQTYLIERYFIDARDLNHAIAMAAQMPQAQGGVIEVVPLRETAGNSS